MAIAEAVRSIVLWVRFWAKLHFFFFEYPKIPLQLQAVYPIVFSLLIFYIRAFWCMPTGNFQECNTQFEDQRA